MTTREEFFAKLQPYHSPSTLMDVQVAYTLAKFGHRAQVRKELNEQGDPIRYFEHVKRVAVILIDEAKITQADMVITALLHDGIEDTRDLSPEIIEHVFGKDVCQMVKVLSKCPKEGYLDRFYRCNDWRPFVIKACDRLDNLRSLHHADESFRNRQLSETRDHYVGLFRHMRHIVPEEVKQAAALLFNEIGRFL